MSEEPTFSQLARLIARSGYEPGHFWEQVSEGVEALFIFDRSRRIVYANAAGRRLMEVDLEEASRRTCVDVLSCPNCECRCRLFEEGRLDDVEVTLYVPGQTKPRVFRKSGRLLRDRGGQVIGGAECFVDITEEVRARAETQRRDELLLSERKRSHALIDTFSEGVFTLGPDQRIHEFSKQLSDLTGMEAEYARGRCFCELFGLDPALRATTSLTANPLDVEIATRAGERTSVRISFLPIRFGSDELLGIVRRPTAPADAAAELERRHGFHGILSRSPRMRELFTLIESAADSDASVLLQGESGTGKELVAHALHALSPRRSQPFFPVNCATFTGGLLLSELFGHERGAFTGAIARQRGKLELAERGTLLLDEVSEIPIEHQAVLLRVLEHRRFERVGGHQPVALDARVIAATNRPLEQAIAGGSFRSDLYYRLNVVPLAIPPLRERPEDVELLAEYFLLRSHRQAAGRRKQLTEGARAALAAYPWPGNVRELKNMMEYLSLTNHRELSVEHLPAYVTERAALGSSTKSCSPPRGAADGAAPPLPSERERIEAALAQTNYRRARAAELLGMDRTTLWRKLRKHGIRTD